MKIGFNYLSFYISKNISNIFFLSKIFINLCVINVLVDSISSSFVLSFLQTFLSSFHFYTFIFSFITFLMRFTATCYHTIDYAVTRCINDTDTSV